MVLRRVQRALQHFSILFCDDDDSTARERRPVRPRPASCLRLPPGPSAPALPCRALERLGKSRDALHRSLSKKRSVWGSFYLIAPEKHTSSLVEMLHRKTRMTQPQWVRGIKTWGRARPSPCTARLIHPEVPVHSWP